MGYNFEFAPVKYYVEKNHTGCCCVPAHPARGQPESKRERSLFQRPPSSRPSPQGEGEPFAASVEKPAAGLVGRSIENAKTCQGGSFSPGEKAKMRAVVKPLFSSPATPFGRGGGRPHAASQRRIIGFTSQNLKDSRFYWLFRGFCLHSQRFCQRQINFCQSKSCHGFDQSCQRAGKICFGQGKNSFCFGIPNFCFRFCRYWVGKSFHGVGKS